MTCGWGEGGDGCGVEEISSFFFFLLLFIWIFFNLCGISFFFFFYLFLYFELGVELRIFLCLTKQKVVNLQKNQNNALERSS